MQAHHTKEVVKDIVSASQLESELVISQAQHGVAVLDVYNAEWGSCKALAETFRRLFTDAGDAVHLRFFSAECNAIVESLHNPDEPKPASRPRGMTVAPDTQPGTWTPILESRRHHSKPYFVFFKEGKIRAQVEGVDTPKICKIVQDLCRQQTPATDFLNNADATRFWETYFSLAESEVPQRNFMEALQKEAAQRGVRPMVRDDLDALAAAIGVSADGSISAAAFEAWMGDSATVAGRTAESIASAAAAAPMRGHAAPVMEASEHEESDEDAAAASSPHVPSGGADETRVEEGHSPREVDETAEAIEDSPEGTSGQGTEDAERTAEAAPSPAVNTDSMHEITAGEETADAAEQVAEASADLEAVHESSGEREVPGKATGVTATSPDEASVPASPPAPVAAQDTTADTEDLDADKYRELGEVATSATVSEEVTTTAVHQIFLDRWVAVTEEEMRVWNLIAALPLHYPECTDTLLVPNDVSTMERAMRLVPPVPETFPTLAAYLEDCGVPSSDVNMMCLAAEQKVGSESLSYGKLALILISSDAEGTTGLLPKPENLRAGLSAGTIVDTHPSLAFTALCLCASEAYPDEHFYFVPPPDAPPREVKEGDEMTLAALTPLHASTPTAGAGRYYRLVGLPKVIELATTDDCEDTMVLSQWFSKLQVVSVSGDEVTLKYVAALCEEEFAEFSEAFTARLIEDEGRLDKKTDLNATGEDTGLEQGDELGDAAEEAADEEADDGPAEL